MLITIAHIHTDQLLKMGFSNLGDFKTCKSIKKFISKILKQNNAFSTTHGLEKVKTKLEKVKFFASGIHALKCKIV